MKKAISIILGVILSLGLISFSYAMVFNSSFTDNGTSQVVNVETGKSMVFSLSKQIDSINFNKDSGFTIRTLEGGEWIEMTDNVSDYTPMKGYMIRNISDGNLQITMNLKNITNVNDTIFQKTLKAGWNLVGPAYKNDKAGLVQNIDAFGNSTYSHIADFTGEGFFEIKTISGEPVLSNGKDINEFDSSLINPNVKNDKFQIRNKSELANVKFIEGLAYAIFVSNDTIIPGSQNLTSKELGLDEIDLCEQLNICGKITIIYPYERNNMDAILQDLFVEDIFLAGTNNQSIYSFKTYNRYKDISISKMTFKIEGGDFRDNFKNIKLISNTFGHGHNNADQKNYETLSNNYNLSYSNGNTYIEFNDINLLKNNGLYKIELVVDLEKYSTNGDDTSIKLGKANISIENIEGTKYDIRNGYDNIISSDETKKEITITPALVIPSITKNITKENNIARVKMNIEKGSNIFDQIMNIKTISGEAIISSVKNINNNDEKYISREITISDGTHTHLSNLEIKDGDIIELQVDGNANKDIKFEYEIAGKSFWTDLISLGDYEGNNDIFGLSDEETTELNNLLGKNYTKDELLALTEIDLSNKNLSSIPNGVFKLNNLQHLELINNNITQIPTEISELSELGYLGLTNNNINYISQDINKLLNLRDLFLSNNNITIINDNIFDIANLKTLSLSNNNITQIPEDITNLQNLEVLYLGGNELGDLSNDFFTFEGSQNNYKLCQNNITDTDQRMCIDSTGDKIVITVMENEEEPSYSYKPIKLNDRDLVLGNGVETVLFKMELTAQGGNYNLTKYDLVPTSENSLSNGLEIDDIIESTNLNIGGETFNGNVTASGITFNFEKELLEGITTETLVTAILKQNDNIKNGDSLSLSTTKLSSTLGEGSFNNYSKTILYKNGNVQLELDEDSIGNEKILAGSNDIKLAGFDLSVEKEDVNIEEITFRAGTDDFSNTLKNIRLYAGDALYSENAIVTYDKYTLIKFTNFNNNHSLPIGEGEFKIIADIENYTTEGSQTSAHLGSFNIEYDSMIIKGNDSNDYITPSITDYSSNKTIEIIPAIMNISINDTFGENDNEAKIKIILDKGQNDLGNTVITSFEFDGGTILENIGEIKSSDHENMKKNTNGKTILATNGYFGDGDTITFIYETGINNSQIKLKNIKYKIGDTEYISKNKNLIDLGLYSNNNNNTGTGSTGTGSTE